MSDATNPPRITIITPSFNQAPFLEETIQSVLDQGYPNLQYGVIDGGSTDGSADIIRRYRDRLDFAVVEKDHGQTEAINKGLKRADGDIVGWLCSDDTLLPGALNTLGKHFAQHPGDHWLAGAVRVIDIAGNPTGKVRPSGTFTLPGVLLRSDQRPFNLPQPGVFWRRALHDELGLLDESLHYCMDFEFWLRLIEAGHRPILIDAELSTYRLHETSKSCAMPMGFTKEHVRIESRYARSLPLLQRAQVMRRMGYMHRASVLASTQGKPWSAVARRPWWLLSQQVRRALRQNRTAA